MLKTIWTFFWNISPIEVLWIEVFIVHNCFFYIGRCVMDMNEFTGTPINIATLKVATVVTDFLRPLHFGSLFVLA